MRTRTNLHLDNEALDVATYYANAKGISLGVAVSELILRGEGAAPKSNQAVRIEKDSHGFPVVRGPGPVITLEMVKEFSEDSFD